MQQTQMKWAVSPDPAPTPGSIASAKPDRSLCHGVACPQQKPARGILGPAVFDQLCSAHLVRKIWEVSPAGHSLLVSPPQGIHASL